MNKPEMLSRGGIAIVCTAAMETMAKAAFEEIAARCPELSIDFHVLQIEHFSMGEFLPHIEKNVRNKHVYLFFDFNEDAARQMFLLTATNDALHRASAKSVTLMVPFIPFQRQDRKDRSRIPITGRVAIETMEMNPIVNRVITLDMHSAQSEMAIKNPFDHLPGFVIFIPWIRKSYGDQLDKVVIVGPDAGSEKRVMGIASRLGCERSFFTKSRAGRGDVEVDVLHGAEVDGKICILNDDIIDTATTIVKTVDALRQNGASEVVISATHPVLGTKDGITAYERLQGTGCEVVVTDSLQIEDRPWINVLPLASLMAHTILENVVVNGSVSEIIENGLPD